ncbi:conserved Plasmodium protein, unknown function [Plasmodium knowlesi strain H]|uniref:Uncharacterized protein n=3 Tax=Plasmodium knowlesi TaxID=5850 RepID=A0A1A7VNU2_PLAKH|nr:conserved Plasmodium protein, unknown function [Plasmodium knowlesi strain H]OTN66775.1 Uncharacterized protein PKNOH_S08504300 [Plasmodium knowlesi]CAA9986688.1 conserved Plasmodium protein, unknown function [Plasmodium knowlesi strain H]SBO23500.1 conserved Plasmodium protein, unknown function [Plasmodium knowlesi strain H]SBO24981.1 conserved Plasmodium protein, unknown function [Plasmodium knowlesi strain H]VVS76162.1 conserved Plasmodium protein, unknown function [Plasmodium knowlesi s
MHYQREIIKWMERKNKLQKGNRSGRYTLFRFKRRVTESLFGEVLCKVGLDGGPTRSSPGNKLICSTSHGIVQGSGDARIDLQKERLPKERLSKERLPKVHLLKRTIQNFYNVRHLLGRNDPVYADLAHVFSQELQAWEEDIIHRPQEDKPNGSNGSNGPNGPNGPISPYDKVHYLPSEHLQRGNNDTIDIVDLMHLFIFYTSMEWHRYNFLIIILRCIIRMGCTANTNQETCLKFLKSCVKLRIEIKKILKVKKGGSIFRLQKAPTHWGKIGHVALIRNGVPSMRVPPCHVKGISGRISIPCRHSAKGLHRRIMLSKRGGNAHRSLPPCGRKNYHFQETYSKWKKRKFKFQMQICNRLMEECTYLVLGRWEQLTDGYLKYIQVLHRGKFYLKRGEPSKSFTAQLADYINTKCDYLPPDELLTAVDYLMKARKKGKGDTQVHLKVGTMKMTRAITRISQHLCTAIQKKTNEYTVGEACTVLSLCARNNYYDKNLLDSITAYVVDNLDQVSSKELIRLAINMYDKLDYTENGLLLAIVNRYRPPRRRGASRGVTDWRRNKRRWWERSSKIRQEENPTSEPAPEPEPEHAPRRNFQSVKISQLLRLLNVFIKKDIHLDEEWADYVFTLIKRKFSHISIEDFPLLCYAILHIQSREITHSFFKLSSRYYIYKCFPVVELPKSLPLTPLIQTMLLLSTQIHQHNRRIFLRFFFNVLKKFFLQSGIPEESAKEEQCTYGGAFRGMSSSPHLRNDHCGENLGSPLSFYAHNLDVYERGRNNKYEKKRKKKKKQSLQNQIAKISIPTCEEMKEEIIPFIKITPPDYHVDVIMEDMDEFTSNKEGKTTSVCTVTTPSGVTPLIQQNRVKANYPTGLTTSVGGERIHKGDSSRQTNQSHVFITCNTMDSGEYIPRYLPLRENKLASGSGGSSDPPFDEPTMKKQIHHETHYFENVANARSILWAIQIVLLHLSEEHPNGCLEKRSGGRCLSSRLNELTLTQLSLLHKTYTLCSSYIDSSLSMQRSLNNGRIVSSSRLHKQILSILVHVAPQSEIISELVHHPFQVDICLRRKPC